jgi:nucleoside-diphosphate-sugar epimerase
MADPHIVQIDDPILVTGANGFIGARVVRTLLEYGFGNLRCFVRPTGNLSTFNEVLKRFDRKSIEVMKGNLLSRNDARAAARGVRLIYHLAAGKGEKSYPNAFMNSVVTTRNLLEGALPERERKRFVNVSSFTVYSNRRLKRGALLDETCAMEDRPELRGEAYCYAKVRQDQLVVEYCRKHGIPYVLIRPGAVYGPGDKEITGRVGIGTFGVFIHLGGSNRIPLTYVDNCAEAIVLAGIRTGAEGEVFNVVDDDLPTSREFLKMYKKQVGSFKSIYLPKSVSYLLCCLWEKYSEWSEGQLPPVFNRRRWSNDWKGNCYTNEKLKKLLGWKPRVGFEEAAKRYFAYCRGDRAPQ